MLISSCGLLSSCSDMWNESLALIEQNNNIRHGEGSGIPVLNYSDSAVQPAVPAVSASVPFVAHNEGSLWRDVHSTAIDQPEYLITSTDLLMYGGSLTEDLRSVL